MECTSFKASHFIARYYFRQASLPLAAQRAAQAERAAELSASKLFNRRPSVRSMPGAIALKRPRDGTLASAGAAICLGLFQGGTLMLPPRCSTSAIDPVPNLPPDQALAQPAAGAVPRVI